MGGKPRVDLCLDGKLTFLLPRVHCLPLRDHCVTTHIYCLRRDSLLKGATYKHSTRVGESILNSEVITCRGSWVGEIGDQKSKGWDDSRIEQHAWSRGMGLRGAIDE